MNIELLRKIQAIVLEEPKRLVMERWISIPVDRRDSRVPECGTMGCVAGWATLLSRQAQQKDSTFRELAEEIRELGSIVQHTGATALKLDHGQATRLFYLNSWPPDFANAFTGASQYPDYLVRRANITSLRIDRFIATDGAE